MPVGLGGRQGKLDRLTMHCKSYFAPELQNFISPLSPFKKINEIANSIDFFSDNKAFIIVLIFGYSFIIIHYHTNIQQESPLATWIERKQHITH